jgi:DNA-binding CsgD family transcriptional regulator
MKSWQEDLMGLTDDGLDEHEVFTRMQAAAAELGFEHFAYGLRAPLPLSNPKTIVLSTYPQAWQERYAQAGYLNIDPTVHHGIRSQVPLLWSDEVFAQTPAFWEEARSYGLKVGWAQSSLDGVGVGGMLSLSRSGEPLLMKELAAKEQRMRWLVHVSHLALARLLRDRLLDRSTHTLTVRELEILKWTGDGLSAQDVAQVLNLSVNTVNFHVKNAVTKLQVANKTAAVVRAAMLGYLH